MKRLTTIKLIGALLGFSLIASVTSTIAWFAPTAVIENSNNPIEGATEGAYFAYGDGSEEKPYGIRKPRHLYNLAWLNYLGFFNKKQFYFELDNDLSMEGWTIPPIGTTKYPFVGQFNGKNHIVSSCTISNEFTDYGTKHPGVVAKSDDFDSSAVKIVGFFGVVGNYNGKYGGASYSSAVNTVSDLGLTNVTVKTYSADTLVGMVAGYSDADIKNVAVDTGNVNVAAGAGTSVISPATKVSEHGIIGYTTKTKDIRKVNETIYAVNVQQKNADQKYLEFNATEQGADNGWGGSIDMKSVTKRLQTIRGTGRASTYYYNRTVVYKDGEVESSTGNRYDSTYNRIINNNDEIGHFQFISGTNQVNERYALLGGGHWQDSTYYETASHTGYRITDGKGHYLNASSFTSYSGSIGNTTENAACVWTVPSGSSGRISTQYYYNRDNAIGTYYLYLNNNQLALTTTANNGITFTKATTTVDGQTYIRYSYNNMYLTYDNGWKMKTFVTRPTAPSVVTEPTEPSTPRPEYPTVSEPTAPTVVRPTSNPNNDGSYFIFSGNSYLNRSSNTAANFVANPNYSDNIKWYFASAPLGNSGTTKIYVKRNGTSYYIKYTESSSWGSYSYTPGLTNKANDGATFNYIKSGDQYKFYINLMEEDGWFDDTYSDFYLRINGTTLQMSTTNNQNSFSVYSVQDAYDDWNQYDDDLEDYTAVIDAYNEQNAPWAQYDSDSEAYQQYLRDLAQYNTDLAAYNADQAASYAIKMTNEQTVPGSDEHLVDSAEGMYYGDDDVTYFPLNTVNNTNDFRPADNNTAYVVGGSKITGSTTTYNDNLTIVRFGYYPISGNISNDLDVSTGTFTHVYTVNDSLQREEITNDAQYVRLSDAKTSLGTVLKDDGTNVYGLHFLQSTISTDALTEAKYVKVNKQEHENYQLPVNSIDFHLKEFGYINFMAGSYFPGNNSESRNDSFFSLYQVERLDSSPTKINRLLKVKKIYKHNSGAKNTSYVYQLEDTSTGATLYTKPYKIVDVAGNREWLYDAETAYSHNQYVNSLPSNYTLAFDVARIEKNSIAENTFLRHVYYFELPMNDGEFCLGSVQGGVGCYLMYLDIAANAAKTQRTIISEHFTYDEKTFAYPVGVAFLPYNDEGIDDTNSVSMTIPTDFAGKTLTVSRSTDAITITENGTEQLTGDLTYLGDSITIASNIKEKLKPKSTTTKDVKRVQYYDYNVNLEKVTKTIITDTYLNGAATPTRVIEQYGQESNGTWTAIAQKDWKVYQTKAGTAYDLATLTNPSSIPLNGAIGSGGIGWVDPGSTVLLSFFYTMAEGVSTTESLTLNMAIDTNVLDGQYYKLGDYAFLITVTGGTITVKVLAKGTGTITINDIPVTAVDQTITVSAS